MNTNKIDLIKAEVERLQKELIQEKEKGFGSDIDDACILELQNVLTYIDSLKEEPKFKTGDRIKPVDSCLGAPRTILEVCDGWYVTNQETLDFEYEDNWEAVEEPVSEDFKQFEEAYLEKEKDEILCVYDRHAGLVDGANWQKNHLWKDAQGDDLPEYDREVIAILDYDFGHYKVVYAHRPNPNGWDGTNIDTGEKEHFEPATYGKGGWNAPNIVYWLDARLPYEENKIIK